MDHHPGAIAAQAQSSHQSLEVAYSLHLVPIQGFQQS